MSPGWAAALASTRSEYSYPPPACRSAHNQWQSEREYQYRPMSLKRRCCDSKVMTAKPNPVKVFLAEDSAMIRSRLAAMMAANDMAVVGEAETAEGSIEGILAARPDVVVLDVQLHDGTGLQVLRAVRAVNPSIAFVVFSNNAGSAYRKRYLGEGADRFLDKTTEIDQLVNAVHASHAMH